MADSFVEHIDATALLDSIDDHTVDAIITSPPYQGLPGRGNTLDIVEELSRHADRVLHADGCMLLLIGGTPEFPFLPFTVPNHVYRGGGGTVRVAGVYVWDRSGSMKRDCGSQILTHDFIFHVTRGDYVPKPLAPVSVLRSKMPGFDFGDGVTTPPDIAAMLVNIATPEDGLIVDPLAGLGEIGVQAVAQGRQFIGGDIDESYARIANSRIANAKRQSG